MSTRVVPVLYRVTCDCGYHDVTIPASKKMAAAQAARHRKECPLKGKVRDFVKGPDGNYHWVWVAKAEAAVTKHRIGS